MVFYRKAKCPLIGVWPPPIRTAFCKEVKEVDRDNVWQTIATYLSICGDVAIDVDWFVGAFETRYPDKPLTLTRLSTFIVEHGALAVGDRHQPETIHSSDWPKAFKRKADRAGLLKDGQDVKQWILLGHPVLHVKSDGSLDILTTDAKREGHFYMVLFPNVLAPVRSIDPPNKQVTSFNSRFIFQLVFLILCFIVSLFFFSFLLHLARVQHLTPDDRPLLQLHHGIRSAEDDRSDTFETR
jgi:hypothetical protein